MTLQPTDLTPTADRTLAARPRTLLLAAVVALTLLIAAAGVTSALTHDNGSHTGIAGDRHVHGENHEHDEGVLAGVGTSPQLAGVGTSPQLAGVGTSPQLAGVGTSPQLAGFGTSPL